MCTDETFSRGICCYDEDNDRDICTKHSEVYGMKYCTTGLTQNAYKLLTCPQ